MAQLPLEATKALQQAAPDKVIGELWKAMSPAEKALYAGSAAVAGLGLGGAAVANIARDIKRGRELTERIKLYRFLRQRAIPAAGVLGLTSALAISAALSRSNRKNKR